MPKIIVQPGQSLLDVAVQHYGSAEGVYDLVRRNRLNGLLDNLEAGQELEIAERPTNARVARFLAAHQVATMEDRLRGAGIGWWEIEQNFRLRHTQTVNFTLQAKAQVGSTLSLAASASTGLPVTYASTDPAIAEVHSGNKLKLNAVGNTVITACQVGNDTYGPAQKTQKIGVAPIMKHTFSMTETYAWRGLTVYNNIIYVAEDRNGRIEMYAKNGTHLGTFLEKLPSQFIRRGRRFNLRGISARKGKLYVKVHQNNVIAYDIATGQRITNFFISDAGGEFIATSDERIYATRASLMVYNINTAARVASEEFTVDFSDIGTNSIRGGCFLNNRLYLVFLSTSGIFAFNLDGTRAPKHDIPLSVPAERHEGLDYDKGELFLLYHPEVRTFDILNRKSQTLTFSLQDSAVAGNTLTLSATSSAGLPVTYTSSHPSIASVSGTTLTAEAAGTATLIASQAGSETYAPATETQTITITTS